MPGRLNLWLHGTGAVLRKDLKLELRSRYILSTLLIFVASALLLVMLAVGREAISAKLQAGLLWIVILFTAALGLGRAFVAEEERGTILLLRLHTRPSMVYAGKLLYSFLLILAVNVILTGVFITLSGVEIALPGLLGVTLLLGTLGLAGVTTLLAAIIARTSRRGTLLPVLLFPLLIPLLLAAVDATEQSLTGGTPLLGGWAASMQSLVAMGSFAGVVISASVLLFDYVWVD